MTGRQTPLEQSAAAKRVFVCHGCGACCRWPGIVRLTDEDVAALAAFLGTDEETFIRQSTALAPDRRSLILDMPAADPCRFLTPDNRCRVYPARPRQCRDFPNTWSAPADYGLECRGEWLTAGQPSGDLPEGRP